MADPRIAKIIHHSVSQETIRRSIELYKEHDNADCIIAEINEWGVGEVTREAIMWRMYAYGEFCQVPANNNRIQYFKTYDENALHGAIAHADLCWNGSPNFLEKDFYAALLNHWTPGR